MRKQKLIFLNNFLLISSFKLNYVSFLDMDESYVAPFYGPRCGCFRYAAVA